MGVGGDGTLCRTFFGSPFLTLLVQPIRKESETDLVSFLPSFIPPSLVYAQPRPFFFLFLSSSAFSNYLLNALCSVKCSVCCCCCCSYRSYEQFHLLLLPSPLPSTMTGFISSLSPAALSSKIFSLFLMSLKSSGLYWGKMRQY